MTAAHLLHLQPTTPWQKQLGFSGGRSRVVVQGKEYVPDTVDHVCVRLDPHEDRSWLQSDPPTPTDKAHAFDKIGPNVDTPECWSEAVKRLKPRVLQRIIDTYKMDQCLIFCRSDHSQWLSNLLCFLWPLSPGPVCVLHDSHTSHAKDTREFSHIVCIGFTHALYETCNLMDAHGLMHAVLAVYMLYAKTCHHHLYHHHVAAIHSKSSTALESAKVAGIEFEEPC